MKTSLCSGNSSTTLILAARIVPSKVYQFSDQTTLYAVNELRRAPSRHLTDTYTQLAGRSRFNRDARADSPGASQNYSRHLGAS